jgi:hypothetical protein
MAYKPFTTTWIANVFCFVHVALFCTQVSDWEMQQIHKLKTEQHPSSCVYSLFVSDDLLRRYVSIYKNAAFNFIINL